MSFLFSSFSVGFDLTQVSHLTPASEDSALAGFPEGVRLDSLRLVRLDGLEGLVRLDGLDGLDQNLQRKKRKEMTFSPRLTRKSL